MRVTSFNKFLNAKGVNDCNEVAINKNRNEKINSIFTFNLALCVNFKKNFIKNIKDFSFVFFFY